MMENEMMNNNNSNILHHQLPWGLTFNPTDEDLMRYLRAKVDNIQLPFVDPILEFDVFTVDHPSQLFYLHQELMNETHVYFYIKKSGKVRSAGNGRWIANKGPVNIFSSEGEMMGERRSLVYYNSKEKIPAKKTRTTFGLYAKLVRQEEPLVILNKFFPLSTHEHASMLQQVDNVELVPQEVTRRSFGGKDYQSSNNVPSQQQQQRRTTIECDDDGDQGWIDNLESTRRLTARNNNHKYTK
ncbi:hypothetical protein Syun_019755 [Stephania yunnanensis]|uniref:NAC domain-containing protein n=1 Tax=Stephania yunnanensis TaxID=152371 RepID=A0AAP0NWY8_9MAGN